MGLNELSFTFISTPKCITVDDTLSPRSVRRVFFSDSIFEFYPYFEFYLKDNLGMISDKVFFVEGLELEVAFGSDEKTDDKGIKTNGYIKNKYVWSENQINNVKGAEHISGDNVFVCTSKSKVLDFPKSRAYNYENAPVKQTIGDIVKLIALNDLMVPAMNLGKPEQSNLFISKTTGFPYVPQNNVDNRDFLKLLSSISYNTGSNVNSPYFTFINSQGEFYFMSLFDMYNQKPVAEYSLAFDLNMTTDDFTIGEYTILQGGMPVNRKNYSKNVFSLQPVGTPKLETVKLHDKELKVNNTDKFLVRSQYITEPTDNMYLGIMDPVADKEYYQGVINNQYCNTDLSYRLIIVVHYNPRAVAGKVVKLNFQKATAQNQYSQEYNGNWLICASDHVSDPDWAPYTQLTLSKQGITVDSDHAFVSDFK